MLVALLALLALSCGVCIAVPCVGSIARIDGLCILVEILGVDGVPFAIVVRGSLECPNFRIVESYERFHTYSIPSISGSHAGMFAVLLQLAV